jgi:tRNA (mo5U34)-methyltransferase
VASSSPNEDAEGLVRYLATLATPATGLPTRPDDLRLRGWYHTIELGDGLVTQGHWDHRPVVDRYGVPESLAGRTALDVGTCDGFWAFELERRGAERVVAIDVERWGDFDWLPSVRTTLGWRAQLRSDARFRIAHAMRRSRVERLVCNVYDLSSETVGSFDVVFCGDVLVHLRDPLRALLNIRAVTGEVAVVATMAEGEMEERFADRPWLAFGHREMEADQGLAPGSSGIYFRFGSRALREALEYVGFARTEAMPTFRLPNGPDVASVLAYVR